MDEFAYFDVGFAAIAWGVIRLIDAAVSLHHNYSYWKERK